MVQNQLKSYSEAVQGQLTRDSGGFINQSVLESVVKNVVAEEDKSRNLLIFELTGESGEQKSKKVENVLGDIGEKPKFDAYRIGLKGKFQKTRPVKISVTSSTVVTQT